VNEYFKKAWKNSYYQGSKGDGHVTLENRKLFGLESSIC
jgi:hypothetical protein